ELVAKKAVVRIAERMCQEHQDRRIKRHSLWTLHPLRCASLADDTRFPTACVVGNCGSIKEALQVEPSVPLIAKDPSLSQALEVDPVVLAMVRIFFPPISAQPLRSRHRQHLSALPRKPRGQGLPLRAQLDIQRRGPLKEPRRALGP